MADEMTRQEFAEYMAAFEQRLEARFDCLDTGLQGHDRRFDGLDTRLAAQDRRFDRLEGGLSDLKQSMTIQFEETRREFKLSLEAVAALDETTRTGFSEMRRDHAEHKADLERAIRHVRVRAEHVEERVERRDAQ